MCYFDRLTRVARWLADYPEWLQFCWDFVKPPRNDEIALQHFFYLAYLFHLCCMQFFSSSKGLQEFFFQNHPPPPPSRVKWLTPKDFLSLLLKWRSITAKIINIEIVSTRSSHT